MPALADVSFRIEAGTVLLVVGPSGSGKSTLAKAIAGLVPGDVPGGWAGTLRVGDLDVSTASRAEASARIGVVFQDPAAQLVMEHAGDDVAFGLENRAWPLAEMRIRVPTSLAQAGLDGFAERRSERLSGGEQQRLALAGALAPRPGVLVLDEPTANLDPRGTEALYRQLAELKTRGETTIVLIEHRTEPAWRLADSVLALGMGGQQIDAGPRDVVLRRSRGALDRAGVWLPDTPSRRSRTERIGDGAPAMVARHTDAPVLDLREVWFGYARGEPVLHGASLAIRPGERVALVGPNGSGKSTLLRLAVGLLRPRAGAVVINGVDPARLARSVLPSHAGYVPQDPEVGFIGDTVREEVELGLADGELDAGRALASRLGLPLERFGDRSPYRLSGGEQRRLSLVTALARRPRLLVLDEPTFGQDRHGHEELSRVLSELAAEGTAMLAATHDERFVAAFADRVAELEEGWLTAEHAA